MATRRNKRGPLALWRKGRTRLTLAGVSLRKFVKSAVTPAAKHAVTKDCDAIGMTEIKYMSRLITWFTGLDDVTRRHILGILPPLEEEAVLRLALKRLKSPAGKKRKG